MSKGIVLIIIILLIYHTLQKYFTDCPHPDVPQTGGWGEGIRTVCIGDDSEGPNSTRSNLKVIVTH